MNAIVTLSNNSIKRNLDGKDYRIKVLKMILLLLFRHLVRLNSLQSISGTSSLDFGIQ